MKKIRLNRIKYFASCIMVLLLVNILPVQAASGNATEKKQIIFILDGSHSMAQERWQEAVDGVAMVATMLPADYEVAMLVYNQEVVIGTEFQQPLEEQLKLLRRVNTSGYTNTGLAVQAALERFDSEERVDKRIVLISDGEISMKTQPDTEEAIILYDEAIESAKEEHIVIDMLLFEPDGFEEQIAQGAEVTGGQIYRKMDSDPIVNFSERYLFERLGIERIVIGTSDTITGEVEISLRDTLAEKTWILMTAESVIEDIQVSCQSKEILTTRGNQFVVIELDEPLENTAFLRYTLAGQGRSDLYMSKEYVLSMDLEAVCLPENPDPQIVVSITNAKGKSLLADPSTSGKVDIYIDGTNMNYSIEQEKAVICYPVELSQEVEVQVGFEQLEGKVICNNSVGSLWLEKPYQEIVEEEQEPYILLYTVIAGVCLVFILSLFLLLKAKKKTKEPAKVSQGVGETPKYDFSGQLVVYMLKNPAGEDMPPASVNLYLRETREPFSFAWVKDKCRIDMPLTDAEKIQFQGGAAHTLCVKNKGEATVTCGKEILLRNRKCVLHYNEKLLLVFNGGDVEIEIHYKNMKPSERKG